MSLLKRLLKYGSFSTSLLILLSLSTTVGGLLWLMASESGLQWIVRQAEQWSPGELKVKTVQGRLIDDFQIDGLRYRHGDLAVQVGHFHWAWHPKRLLGLTLHIKQLVAENIVIQLPASQATQESPSSQEPFKLPDIYSPIDLVLDELNLKKVSIQTGAAAPVIIDSVSLSTTVKQGSATQRFTVQSPLLSASLTGELGLQSPHRVQADLSWLTHLPNSMTISGYGNVQGDLQALHINHQTEVKNDRLLAIKPLRFEWQATLQELLGHLQWRAVVKTEALFYPLDSQAESDVVVKGQQVQLVASGTLENYQFDLETRLTGQNIPPGQWRVIGSGDLQQVQFSRLEADLLEGKIAATGKVVWQPHLTVQISLEGTQLTLQPFWAGWGDKLRLNTQLNATLEGQQINIARWAVQTNLDKSSKPLTQLELQGTSSIAEPSNPNIEAVLKWQGLRYPLDSDTSGRPSSDLAGVIVSSQQGQAKVTGNLQHYRVLLDTHLMGEQVPPGQYVATLNGNLNEIQIESLKTTLIDAQNPRVFQGSANAEGKVSWSPQLEAQLNLSVQQLDLKPYWKEWPDKLGLNGQVKAAFKEHLLKINSLKIQTIERGNPQRSSGIAFSAKTLSQLTAEGEVDLKTAAPIVKAQISWQGLQYPLDASLRSKHAENNNKPNSLAYSQQGTLKFSGTLDNYQLGLETQLEGQTIPPGHWQVAATGNLQHIKIHTLHSKILDGSLSASGQVAWQPFVSWDIFLKGKEVNPGQWYPDFPGNLSLESHSRGHLQRGLEVDLEVKELRGKLRNYPLKLQSKLAAKNEIYQIDSLDLQVGDSRLNVSGQVGQQMRLTWTLKASDLATLLPNAKGKVDAKGSINGTLAAPHIGATVRGQSLGLADNQLGKLSIDLEVDAQNEARKIQAADLKISILAQDFKQAEQLLVKQCQVQTKGSLAAHTLTLDLQAVPVNVALQLQGGIDLSSQQWQGAIQQLRLQPASFETWQLQTTTPLQLSPQVIRLGRLCLQGSKNGGQLCSQANWAANGDSALQVQLRQLSLGLLQPFLPANSQITGTVEGDLSAQQQKTGELAANLAVKMSAGQIKSHDSMNEPLQISYQGGGLQARIDSTGLTATLEFLLKDKDGLKGSLSLPNFNRLPPPPVQPLEGRLQVTLTDLGLLPTLVPQAENTKGTVQADLAVSGSLSQPRVQGQVELRNAAVDLPDVGLQLREIHFKAQGDGKDTLHLQAGLRSGKGQMGINGDIKLLTLSEWNGKLRIVGNTLEVVNIPNVVAYASPTIDITLQPDKINVNGKIDIPEGAITPTEAAASAVYVSKDVIIVNPKAPTTETSSTVPLSIQARIQINLGDKVTFKGMGFSSRLGGALTVNSQPGKVTVGNGELYILNGVYKAYGQNLKIERGRVIFAGGPVDNPGLDIRATRQSGEVTAGIYVQGDVKSPQLTLFSEPALDQTNTLSYILLGKPVSQASSSDGQLLASAASSLPLAQGDNLAKKIGETFGLDEASISSEGGFKDASVVLGKYLSPSLYISYGIGLFDAANLFRIRYQLSKHWTLESQTGTQSGVDLRYVIER